MNFSLKGFIPTINGGSDSTYVPDYMHSDAGARVAAFGGYAGYGLLCGAAFLGAESSSYSANVYLGSGISFYVYRNTW